jgi:hypothetical protein
LLALLFLLVLVVVLVLEGLSNPFQSWMVGMTAKRPAADEADGSEAEAPNPAAFIPLLFEDDHDEEDDLVAATPS